MIKETQYINIRNILDRLLRHPLLQDTTLEQVIQYTLDFIGVFGLPDMYLDKQETIAIQDFRGKLPCDCISINQVKECETNKCLRSMTDSFAPRNIIDKTTGYKYMSEPTFKTQGQIIYTSFEEGTILISYKSIPVDSEGYPMLPNNSIFLRALEAFIKKELFTVLFDMGKIQLPVLQNTQQQYSWLAGQLQSEYTIPSISEMESIKNGWCTLIQRVSEFNDGFNSMGNREYLKLQ